MAMVLVLSIAGALCVKERVAFEGKKEESYTFRELLQFLRYKPVWAMFVMALVAGVGSNIAGGAGAYFYTYIMGDMTLMSGVSLVSMITALVGIFLGPFWQTGLKETGLCNGNRRIHPVYRTAFD